MTPMIDVVFLLIIFFLVSSHLARQETQLELALPTAKSGEDDLDQETPRVTINVKPDGTMWLAGRIVRREELTQKLRAVAKEKQNANVKVRIRGSKQAAYASIEPIMIACTKSGIWQVDYAVYGEED